MTPRKEDLEEFGKLLEQYRYDFCRLVYVIFPFGEPGHPLEHMAPYDWQMREWYKMSKHFSNPETRDKTYRLIVSSGNGAAKTAFGAMTAIMLMYTQRVRARITANTDPQMKQIVWPEYDIWFNHARFVDHFFEKLGTSIKARDPKLAEVWRIDTVNWSEQTPAAISGLHNKGGVAMYIFEEAPGIPAIIWKYAAGAFTETDTMKIHMAFGNSDDPESKFEQNMVSPLWNSLRIDTRDLKHISKDQIEAWLIEAGGDEDDDDFRVRVRGLPRKSSKDSIIKIELVEKALLRRLGYDRTQLSEIPLIIGCDPAWKGGDETVIWMRQGPYAKLLERFKLKDIDGATHAYTYNRMCYWEAHLGADAVFLDQAEGTAIYTLAVNDGKSWEIFSFALQPTDAADKESSEYANLRAMMYYFCKEWLRQGAILDFNKTEGKDNEADIKKQLTWTKGTRHKITNKKLCESKKEIIERVGQSPDVADGLIITFARPVYERLPENQAREPGQPFLIGGGALKMPDHPDPYEDLEVQYRQLYD